MDSKKKTILKNILVVIAGIGVGGGLNGLIVKYSDSIVPLPPGVDTSNPESIAENIHLFSTGNFMVILLAHALGTLLASFLIAKFVESHHYRLAMIPGILFLIGGIMMTTMVPAPTWFDATDLLLAYFPMAFLGYILGRPKN